MERVHRQVAGQEFGVDAVNKRRIEIAALILVFFLLLGGMTFWIGIGEESFLLLFVSTGSFFISAFSLLFLVIVPAVSQKLIMRSEFSEIKKKLETWRVWRFILNTEKRVKNERD